MLLENYKKTGNAEIIPTIKKLISTSFELRSKKVLIEAFIENIDSVDNVSEEWSKFIQKKAIEELNEIINANNLKKDNTFNLFEFSFKIENLDLYGTTLDEIMPPVSLYDDVEEKEDIISEILNNYFDKYVGMVFTLKGDNYL